MAAESKFTASEIREFVLAAFSKLTRQTLHESSLMELILIRDGAYRGRSYRYGEWMANWLIEAHLVQFYDPQGEILQSIDLSDTPAEERRAA